ncbi:hypothetical protein [Vibrio crassostreae]|uniref:hypothetical protein n=1 Tax=Vibrio crassostreae TaxID=246167 RepID=UPI001B317549|nr:hypothetical protein [Vibrio crassostreae]
MKKKLLKSLVILALTPSIVQAVAIRDDHKKHLGATFAISYASSAVFDNWGYEGEERFWRSAITGIGVGIAKEIMDSQEKGNHFDNKDLVYDVFGSLLGAASYEIYDDWRLNVRADSKSVFASFSLDF